MLLLKLIGRASCFIGLTIPLVFPHASAQPASADGEDGSKTSPHTGVVAPGASPALDKFADMPDIYIFEQALSWKGKNNPVYDKDGKVVYDLTAEYDDHDNIHILSIKDTHGKNLLSTYMVKTSYHSKIRCTVDRRDNIGLIQKLLACSQTQQKVGYCDTGRQVFPTNRAIDYTFHARSLAPDQWHIRGEGLKNKNYIYHRRANTDTGSIKIGESKTDRVAKIFRKVFLNQSILESSPSTRINLKIFSTLHSTSDRRTRSTWMAIRKDSWSRDLDYTKQWRARTGK